VCIDHSTAVPSDAGQIHALLLPLLHPALGSAVELAGLDILKSRHDYVVLLAHLRRPTLDVLIKRAGPQAPLACPFDVSATVYRLVAERTTIPMPAVLTADTSYEKWPWRYFIRTHLPGHEWVDVRRDMSAREQDDAGRQMAEAIAQIHQIGFPLFGELTADGAIQGSFNYLPALAAHARRIIRSRRLQDRFLEALEARAGDFSDVQTAGLCHEDLHQHNILFERRGGKWRLSAILDFEKAWAGHGESDLARIDFWDAMGGDAFWDAYRALQPVSPAYRRRQALYQLLWCLEFAHPSPRHLADTRQLCETLGIAPIETFE
jgi:aminoglycoside phosphotransferase (APT) family kinase protein